MDFNRDIEMSAQSCLSQEGGGALCFAQLCNLPYKLPSASLSGPFKEARAMGRHHLHVALAPQNGRLAAYTASGRTVQNLVPCPPLGPPVWLHLGILLMQKEKADVISSLRKLGKEARTVTHNGRSNNVQAHNMCPQAHKPFVFFIGKIEC